LAFEWNKGALKSLVDNFMDVEPEEPSEPEPLPLDHDKQRTGRREHHETNEPTGQRDYLGYYVPASHGTPKRYGIHFCADKMRWQATKMAKESSSLGERDIHEALIVKVFWHEVGHAWIEDIVASIGENISSKEEARKKYLAAQERWGAYIFLEEAICNTIALRMLRFYLRESENSLMIEAFKTFMKSQGKGYSWFRDLGLWGLRQDELEEDIVELLEKVYKFSKEPAEVAVKSFFAWMVQVPWCTHDRQPLLPEEQQIPPFFLRWKHPLHAEKLKESSSIGEDVGQPNAPILAAALELDTKTLNKLYEEKSTGVLLSKLFVMPPEVFQVWDFIGPHAPLRVIANAARPLRAASDEDLQTIEQLRNCADCYEREPFKGLADNEILVREIKRALIQKRKKSIEI
jgi:hypothetical protein